MLILIILRRLWLVLSLSAAAPINPIMEKEASEEDFVTSVDIVNGDDTNNDDLQNTNRDPRIIFWLYDTLRENHAHMDIASIISKGASQDPPPVKRPGKVSFKGYRVYRAVPGTDEAVQALNRLHMDNPHYDFWTEVVLGRPADIMVAPDRVLDLKMELHLASIPYSIMIDDVNSLMELEKAVGHSGNLKDFHCVGSPANTSPRHAMSWDEYHTLEDMYTYLDYLEGEFDFVSTEIIGQSTEGRDMRVAAVCRGGCGNKPAVWIDGGIHAREWISPAVVTWMLKELVENDVDHADLTEQMDWFFLPSANPDGYAFSREYNRMWRKTRSDHHSEQGCKGVDANRNWGFHFNEGGSSNDKCLDDYHGPEAFSEPENRHVRDFLAARKGSVILFNSVHSYLQKILLPWGYTTSPPTNYQTMKDITMKGSDALTAVHGKHYEVGCIPCLFYIASGGSVDWAHGENEVPFAMAMELRDNGTYGFILPPEQIIPTAEETWAFHLTVAREILKTL